MFFRKKNPLDKKKFKQVVVIGIGRFGQQVVDNLLNMPFYRILAIDVNEINLQKLSKTVDGFYKGDSSNEAFIDELGLDGTDIFILGIGTNIEASLLTAVILKKKFKNSRIIAKASSENHELVLNYLGIKETVYPERSAAKRTIMKIANPIFDIKFANENNIDSGNAQEFEGGMLMVKIPIPTMYEDKKLRDCNFPKDLTIVMVYREGRPTIIYGDFILKHNDEIFVLGKSEKVINYISSIHSI